MEEHNDRIYDKFIREVVQEEIHRAPTPPLSSTEAWSQLQRRMEKDKNTLTPNLKNKYKYLAACILIIFTVVALSPQRSLAFSKLTEIFHVVQGTITQIFMKTGNPPDVVKNAPPSNDFSIVDGTQVISEQMSLEQAQSEASFPIIIPEVIPADFVFNNVTLIKKHSNEESNEIYLNYNGDNRTFVIIQKTVGHQISTGAIVDHDDTKYESIMINGQDATLAIYKNNTAELLWSTQNYYFTIKGELTAEEIVQIAESM